MAVCEAAEWRASVEGCFLKTADGSSYVDVFRRLRLNYIVTEYNSASVVETDSILPRGISQSISHLILPNVHYLPTTTSG